MFSNLLIFVQFETPASIDLHASPWRPRKPATSSEVNPTADLGFGFGHQKREAEQASVCSARPRPSGCGVECCGRTSAPHFVGEVTRRAAALVAPGGASRPVGGDETRGRDQKPACRVRMGRMGMPQVVPHALTWARGTGTAARNSWPRQSYQGLAATFRIGQRPRCARHFAQRRRCV